MRKEYRAHPLMMLKFIKPFLFVLLLPIIRAAIQYINLGEINGFFKFEFLVFGVIIAIAALRCMAFRVSCDNQSVYIRTGILFIKRCEIQISKLSSVQTARNPFDVIFGSVTFRINTEAGTYKRSDFEFKLRFSDAKELSKLLYGGEE
ncbi:MAG: PH domain-containing protein, partial [Clostridia bacterium]|nr:PH domain-containing protein [Clostridia bacterium]